MGQALKRTGVKGVLDVDVKKHTDTVQRHRVSWAPGGFEGRITAETSFRRPPEKDEIQMVEAGILVLTPQALLKRKFEALEHRTAGRDLYDIGYLASAWPETFSPEDRQKLLNLCCRDTEARFSEAFEEDPNVRGRLGLAMERIEKAAMSFMEDRG